MTFDWASLGTEVLDVVKEMGQEGTLNSIVNTPPDSNKPWKPDGGDVPTDHTVYCVPYDASPQEVLAYQGQIEERDRLMIIAASGLTAVPDKDDTVEADGITYRIMQVLNRIDPGGTDIAFIVQIRA